MAGPLLSLSFVMVLDSLIAGQWVPAGPNPSPLLDAVHGTLSLPLDASNVDLASAYSYGVSMWAPTI